MTRKDYVVIARALAKATHSTDHSLFSELIANELQWDNSRAFDRERFYKAAGKCTATK